MRPLIKAAVLAACAMALLPAAASAQSCPNPPDGTQLAASKAAVLCLVNAERTSRGLPALHQQHTLRSAARRFARRMVRQDFFAHNRRGLIRRIRRAGYLRRFPHWRVG